ncbi:PTPRS-like protein, partial [Mya arenaria]
DDTRVKLSDCETDYINASFIDKDKCEQYWPNPGTDKHYGRVFISCQTEAEYAEFTRREFTISKDSETRQLHHLHFTCWPDKGVPEDVTGIVEFRQRVLNLPDQFDGPVLVHCRHSLNFATNVCCPM